MASTCGRAWRPQVRAHEARGKKKKKLPGNPEVPSGFPHPPTPPAPTHTGHPAFQHVVRALEMAFHCRFVRKEWHEGTEDGHPTPFHQKAEVDGGLVTLKLRTLTTVPVDGHSLGIRIETGVDVALALAMVQDSPEYGLLVVVTGDAELEEAFERAKRRIFVCGLRDGLAAALRPWIMRSEGNRSLHLEDVLATAQALGRTEHHTLGVATAGLQQHVALPPGLGPQQRTDYARVPPTSTLSSSSSSSSLSSFSLYTPTGAAPNVSNNGNGNGGGSYSPIGTIPTSGESRKLHLDEGVGLHHHGLGAGSSSVCTGSTDGSSSSGGGRSKRRKSSKLRLRCFAGHLCTKVEDEEHLRRTTHPCRAGLNCRVLRVPNGPEKALHMERFLHPCSRGSACQDGKRQTFRAL